MTETWQMRLDSDVRTRWDAAAAERGMKLSQMVKTAVEAFIASPVPAEPMPLQVVKPKPKPARAQPATAKCADGYGDHEWVKRNGQGRVCRDCGKPVYAVPKS